MEYEGKLIRAQGDEVTFKLDRDFDLAEAHVALYTSAWIEITIEYSPDAATACRTLHECVD